ncbi:MAG: LytTR family transcriptional regulator DNA-binding domain-containing protein, partial [Sulfolobales archaeon]
RVYSVTLSIHTPLDAWLKIPYKKLTYSRLEDSLLKGLTTLLRENLELSVDQMDIKALATPHTFSYFIGRKSLGGIPVIRKNTPWKTFRNLTPLKGLYFLSDQSLFYQGWVGISLRFLNLHERTHRSYIANLSQVKSLENDPLGKILMKFKVPVEDLINSKSGAHLLRDKIKRLRE